MRRTLLEIENLTIVHALLVAVVLAVAAIVWLRREWRLDRMEEKEYRESIPWVVGVAIAAAVGIYIVSRFVSPILIRSYGVLLMVAFIVGIVVAAKRAGRYRIDPLYIIDFALLVLAGSILGSRAMYIGLNWSAEYAQNPASVLSIWEGGLAYHGGLIGGVAGGFLFCWWRKARPAFVADLVAPSVAFGYAVARIGCFLNGCCHGGETHLPWAVDFPGDSYAAVHPVQFYASAGSLAIGLVLLWAAKRVRVPGHVAMWYLVLYAVLRSAMEVFRRGFTAEPWSAWPLFTQAQAASIAAGIVALVVIIVTRQRVGYPLPEPEPPERPAEPKGKKKRNKPKRKRRS